MEKAYVTKLYVMNGQEFTPINIYVTSHHFYDKFKKTKIYESIPSDGNIVDTTEPEGGGGVIYLGEREAWYKKGARQSAHPIEVRKGYINPFKPFRLYRMEDIVYRNGNLYCRRTPGVSVDWVSDEWMLINSGDELKTLTLYKLEELRDRTLEIPEGVFFYGDWIEAGELIEFYDDMIIHDGLVIHDNL
ncbi:hypothetical protein SM033_00035 [Vibrio phage vB_VpaM_sm033]|nr:hypothetical protein SM033_00035 [Vibrio phage vB_VpaM_sm033]